MRPTRDPEAVRWILAADALPVARELVECQEQGVPGPHDHKWADLSAALLLALEKAGVRVAGNVEGVRDAVARARPDYVRVILSVTTDATMTQHGP